MIDSWGMGQRNVIQILFVEKCYPGSILRDLQLMYTLEPHNSCAPSVQLKFISHLLQHSVTVAAVHSLMLRTLIHALTHVITEAHGTVEYKFVCKIMD